MYDILKTLFIRREKNDMIIRFCSDVINGRILAVYSEVGRGGRKTNMAGMKGKPGTEDEVDFRNVLVKTYLDAEKKGYTNLESLDKAIKTNYREMFKKGIKEYGYTNGCRHGGREVFVGYDKTEKEGKLTVRYGKKEIVNINFDGKYRDCVLTVDRVRKNIKEITADENMEKAIKKAVMKEVKISEKKKVRKKELEHKLVNKINMKRGRGR